MLPSRMLHPAFAALRTLPKAPPLVRFPNVPLPDHPAELVWRPGEVDKHEFGDEPDLEGARSRLREAIALGEVPMGLLRALPREDVAAAWRAVPPSAWRDPRALHSGRILAAVGVEALPTLLAMQGGGNIHAFEFGAVLSPDMALVAARHHGGHALNGWGAWLLEHRSRVVPWLARFALGGEGRQRSDARRAFALLIRETDASIEREALLALGATCEQVDRVLWPDADLSEYHRGLVAHAPPRAWRLAPVSLRDGTTATPATLAFLLGVLAKGYPRNHPILAPVHAVGSADALDQLLDGAWEEWKRHRVKAHDWLVEARVRRRGSGAALELVALLPAWAAEPDMARVAKTAAGLVGRYADADAIAPLAELVARPRRNAHALQAAFDQLRARIGDGVEESLDRAVPTGGHSREVALDSAEMQRVFIVQRMRLEAAMVTERAYPPSHFRAHIAGHPLLRRLVAGHVWRQGERTFRVAEDGTFADAHGLPLALGEAPVQLAHPIDLEPDLRAHWARIFSTHAIEPVFSQLDRDTHDAPPVDGWQIRVGALLGATRLGWVKVFDENWIEALERTVGGIKATVWLSPRIFRYDIVREELRTVGPPVFVPAPTRVIRSEILRELYQLERAAAAP